MEGEVKKFLILSSYILSSVFVDAQDSADAQNVEEVTVVGSRSEARSPQDTFSPVDVISGSEFQNNGDTDFANLMRNLVPSFSVNDQPISDAASIMRPANLRGMSPDHTLLLVNGKRRHRGSVLTWLGAYISDGAQGPDVSAIPASAIKSVEVLRDGASAQYGSDAIAGVINFNLNDNSEGGFLEYRYGQYGEGDGEQSYLMGNYGLPMGDGGFFNTSFEYGSQDATVRAVQRDDAAGLIADGYQGVPDPAMPWGRPIVDDDLKAFFNFRAPMGGGEFYGHGNYNSKHVDGTFYYRNPTNRGAVYSNDSGETMLIGDLTPNDGQTCPTVAFTGSTPDPVAWAAVQADPNCFNFQELIPGGFTPRFGADVVDRSVLLGFDGEFENGMTFDFSYYYGYNEADEFLNNSVNASYGPNTPRDFDVGAEQQEENNLNADFTYQYSDTIFIAFGYEHRTEEYSLVEGQPESYLDGGLATQGFSLSSNGYPGFPAAAAGSWQRENDAVYLDYENDFSDNLRLGAALRFEDYDTFGNTSNYKFGFNYKFSDELGARGTFSTGFKAPTPGQANARKVSTVFDSSGDLVNEGVIPSTLPLAVLYGGKVLQPEEAENISLGFFGSWGEVDFTADFFRIVVEDRLVVSANFALSDTDIADLIAQGVPGAGDFPTFRYFTNDFDTKTNGFDLNASFETENYGGTTYWNASWSQNKVEITDAGANIDALAELSFKGVTPDDRGNFTANHFNGNWRVLGRASYWGEWFDTWQNAYLGSPGQFGATWVFDMEVAYDMGNSSVMMGINNVFDNVGDSVTKVNACPVGGSCANEFDITDDVYGGILGQVYSELAPMGISGQFLYLRYRYNF